MPTRIGRYEIRSELGRGSMGRVYVAHDPHTDRDLALKVVADTAHLPPEAAAEMRARFLVEARAAGRLAHPGIVTVYDADIDAESGCPFLAMELVRGRSLAQLLRKRGALPWREAAGIAAAVAAALDHAHQRAIVHRDVKPANVLIDDVGTVKVSDFGVAKIADESHTRTGAVLGTPNYMSPEQLRGEPVDGRSDLFALGSLLFEMLTGRPPFQADSIAGIIHQIVYVEPRPPSRAGAELPAELERIVLRALAKSPADRFRNCRELAAALETLARAGTEPVPAAPTLDLRRDERAPAGAPPPPMRGTRRSWVVPAGLALLVVGGLAGGYRLGLREEAPGGTAPAELAPEVTRAAALPAAPERVQTPPPRTPRGAPATGAATLQVAFNNRLRHGTMTIWVDGEQVWASPLNVRKDPLQIAAGQPVRASLELTPGEHRIAVRIAQAAARIDSRGEVRARFEPGQRRALRVVLLPYVPTLELEWY